MSKTRTQTLKRLLEVTWFLRKTENNEAMNILTFWWWSRSSLKNCVNSWGIKAWSVQQWMEPTFCNPVSVSILLRLLASTYTCFIHLLQQDHLTFLGSCCLEILMDLDRHTLGSAGSLLSYLYLISPHIYISVKLDASPLGYLCLLLIILCVLPSSRSPGWTGGCVPQAPPGDASSCSIISWIRTLCI